MKKLLPLLLVFAAPLAAKQYPSDISVGVEAGPAAGSLSNHDQGRVFGGRLKIDLTPEWSAAAKLQSRTFKTKNNPSQRTSLQPIFAAAYYNFRPSPLWNPYLFTELGLSHNRSTVFSLDSAKSGAAGPSFAADPNAIAARNAAVTRRAPAPRRCWTVSMVNPA